jgi:RimJ/RimL family protein N-acetyltransferase
LKEYDIFETWNQRAAMVEGITIYTARLILRPWRIKDLESLAKLYADLRADALRFYEKLGFKDTHEEMKLYLCG